MSEHWDEFVEAMKDARSKRNDPGIPIQFMAFRGGKPLGFGGMKEGDLNAALKASVAILGGLSADVLYVGADAYHGGPDGINPMTGEKWEEGEMEFDFAENPNTVVTEGLMIYEVNQDAEVTRSGVTSYTRDEEGFPNSFSELEPIRENKGAAFEDGLKHYMAQVGDSLRVVQKVFREAHIDEQTLTTMDIVCVQAMREANSNLQFALMIDLNSDSERTKMLKELAETEGFEIRKPGGNRA